MLRTWSCLGKTCPLYQNIRKCCPLTLQRGSQKTRAAILALPGASSVTEVHPCFSIPACTPEEMMLTQLSDLYSHAIRLLILLTMMEETDARLTHVKRSLPIDDNRGWLQTGVLVQMQRT